MHLRESNSISIAKNPKNDDKSTLAKDKCTILKLDQMRKQKKLRLRKQINNLMETTYVKELLQFSLELKGQSI